MFGKLAPALVAAIVIGTAAMTPTSASARGFGGGFHGSHGYGFGGGYRHFGYSYGYGPGWCYWHPYACSRY
jgi:hypothetical protein